jgi:transposase-like protein
VSAVAKHLDAAVAAFYRRPLKDIYRVLVLDGVVLRRKTGAGALTRPVLVALGLRPDGRTEVIDFSLASAESAAQWEQFLGDLVRRGLGERLEMLCVDGGSGLLAGLPTAFSEVPVQRCWAHKIRNVLNKVRKPDQATVKAGLHRIMNAPTLPAAWSAARYFAERWESACPKAVACLRADLDDLFTCFRYPTLAERKTYARRMRSNAALARSAAASARWAPSRTAPRWNASCSPYSCTRTATRASPPLRPDTQLLTLPYHLALEFGMRLQRSCALHFKTRAIWEICS